MADQSDKRLYPRFSKRLKLRYRTGDGKWRSAFSRDISSEGLYIHTTLMPSDATIEIEVSMDETKILLKGKVVRGKKVPVRLRRMIKSGMAVRILMAPEAWGRFCENMEDRTSLLGNRFVQVST